MPVQTRAKRKYLLTEDENVQKKMKTTRNQNTFAFGTPVNEIPEGKLIILDDYAFDIEELNFLPDKDLFTNMHTQTEFSEEAKNILLANELLKQKARGLVSKTIIFPEAFLQDIYNLGITLHQKRDSNESIEALVCFNQKLDDVYSNIAKDFLSFTIKTSGYNQNAKMHLSSSKQVSKLFTDISESRICIRAGANWLIQLVRTQKPELVDERYVSLLNEQFVRTLLFTPSIGNMKSDLKKMMQDMAKNEEQLMSIVNKL